MKHLVEIFREVRRVMRPDATLWLNLGDSYASGGRGGGMEGPRGEKQRSNKGALLGPKRAPDGLKDKDLVGIPWRVAFALQADGWYLRSDIIWSKPNPMPESVTDRPTKSHEYLFLLSKAATYYYDNEAIKEPLESSSILRLQQPTFDRQLGGPKDYGASGINTNRSARRALVNLKGRMPPPQVGDSPEQYAALTGRNRRTVWEIATAPFPDAHFATFPPALVTPCILAGTSERGACAACGAPWERIVERTAAEVKAPGSAYGFGAGRNDGGRSMLIRAGSTTLGWRPTCACGTEETRPCVVLDPFAGAGTVPLVAQNLGRVGVGIELKAEYLAMAAKRTAQGSLL